MDVKSVRADLVKALNLLSEAYDLLRPYVDLIDSVADEEPAPVEPVEDDPSTDKEDWEHYLDRYDDVKKAGPYSRAWAELHYKNWGKKEGRFWGKEPDAVEEKRFHHYNPRAWHTNGVAVILCPGDRAESARIGNTFLRKHGNLDKGREVWADYNSPGLTGTLTLTINGKAYSYTITDDDNVTKGDCWRD